MSSKSCIKSSQRNFAINQLNSLGIHDYNGKKLIYMRLRGQEGLKPVFKKYFHKTIEKAYGEHKLKSIIENKDYTGYVYIIGNLEYKFCKIGYSVNPEKRLKEIQTGCPFSLSVLKKYEGTIFIETKLHKKYKQYRVRNKGEWFYLKGKLLEIVSN